MTRNKEKTKNERKKKVRRLGVTAKDTKIGGREMTFFIVPAFGAYAVNRWVMTCVIFFRVFLFRVFSVFRGLPVSWCVRAHTLLD